MRIHAGRDDVREEFFAALENHARSTPILDKNLADGRLRSNLDSGFSRRVRDSIRNSASATAAEPPGPKRAVNFAHIVMQQNVSRARRTNAKKCTDDARSGHRRL